MDEKTQFIEAALDIIEERMDALVKEDRILDALALGDEFREWMRAPYGFDHDVFY